jgi:hypothetical protein
VAPLEAILAARGFRLEAEDVNGRERKWVHGEFRPMFFEVLLDIGHDQDIWHCSLRHDDIADAPQRAATLLIIAIIHGATSHTFSRLQHVVDVCQAARHVADSKEEAAFAALARTTNTQKLAAASLFAFGRIMAESRCTELATMVGGSRLARLAGRSLGRTALTGAKDDLGPITRLQRKIWREAILRGSALLPLQHGRGALKSSGH